ncbi:protein kinase domain-containing protein [Mycolicibacterium thermoresistibile]
MLHRDVKPANILLSDPHQRARRILLADFGIARGTFDRDGLTATNMTVGSVAYAAPEQLTGKPLDGRADQYALAATAFHLLTGTLPFSSSNPAVVIGNHLSSPPPRLADIREDLSAMDSVLATAMAKEPHQRFPTCRDFAIALAGHGAGAVSPTDATWLAPRTSSAGMSGTPDLQPGAASRTFRPSRSSPRIALMVGVVTAALLAVGLVAFLGARLGQSPGAAPSAAPSPTLASPAWPETVEPPQSIPEAAPPTPTTPPPNAPPATQPAPTPPPRAPVPPPRQAAPNADLGLTQPMSRPSCNGQGIVVLGSVTTPGRYAEGVQRLLAAHPGSSYLRTDQTCPSLRAATEAGNPIYAVYRPAGYTRAQVCVAVRSAGGDAYGKWLDYTNSPDHRVQC